MSRILSLEQKIFIVKWYYKKNESLLMVESQFEEVFHFNPILTVFDHVLRAFEATGSVIGDVSYVIDEGQPSVTKELHDSKSDRAIEVAQEDGSEDLSEIDTGEGATTDHHSSAPSSEADEPATQPRRMGRPRKPVDNLTCGICSKECKSRRSYLGHLKLHGAKEYVCSVCNYACSTRKYLKVHEQKHVPMEERIRMECKLCHRVYTNKSAFNNHRASHRKVARVEEPSVCTICAKVYSSRKYLTAHMKHFHRDSCTYDCLVCRRSFKTHGNLREHQETHKSAEEREKVECDICHATLLRQCLRKHMKYMHGEDKDWVCEVCGKSMRKGAIKVHMRSHTGERAYECHVCKKGFASKNSRNSHLRTHTGERPFKCDACDMAFATAMILRNHQRTHSDDRPYKCHLCDKSSKLKESLRRHIRNIHGIQ